MRERNRAVGEVSRGEPARTIGLDRPVYGSETLLRRHHAMNDRHDVSAGQVLFDQALNGRIAASSQTTKYFRAARGMEAVHGFREASDTTASDRPIFRGRISAPMRITGACGPVLWPGHIKSPLLANFG